MSQVLAFAAALGIGFAIGLFLDAQELTYASMGTPSYVHSPVALMASQPSRAFGPGVLGAVKGPSGAVTKSVMLPGRWPLPDIPLALYTDSGACVLGGGVCDNPAHWFGNEDVHVRDIITSCLMKCVFRPGCKAADLGGNVGLMTYTMLALGAHVTTVEPQDDMAETIKRTAALNGWDSRSQVVWGGVTTEPGQRSMSLNMGSPFRLGGHTRNDTIEVPLYNLTDVLTPGHYDFVKIDTDSIDCPLLAQFVRLVQTGSWSVDSFILETWEGRCKGGLLAGALAQLQQLNYTVYRTLLWERQFDSRGSLPTALAVDKLPEYATEVFDVRFARYLWKLAPMDANKWKEVVDPRSWQLFITREKMESSAMVITERT